MLHAAVALWALISCLTAEGALALPSPPPPPSLSPPLPSPSPPPPRIPSLPSWAFTIDTQSERLRDYARNNLTITTADAAKKQWDLLLYGDSITVFHMRNKTVWNKYFSGQYKAEPLGVGGNTVEELTWRLMANGETPKIAPKNIALLIGFNNLKWSKTNPVDKMDFLLGYLRVAMPGTRIFLLALLPTTAKGVDVKPTNIAYRNLAMKHGAIWTACGQALDSRNKILYKDGIHPKAPGHDEILKCLKQKVFPSARIMIG